MKSFIIEKKGRKLTRKTARRSIPTARSRNKSPIVSFPSGARGWPAKHVAIVTVAFHPPPTSSAVSVRRCVVYIGSGESQQDQNLPWKAQGLYKTNCSWHRSSFPKQSDESGNFTAQHFSQLRVVHLAHRAATPSKL